jgi:hypothetical protein
MPNLGIQPQRNVERDSAKLEVEFNSMIYETQSSREPALCRAY